MAVGGGDGAITAEVGDRVIKMTAEHVVLAAAEKCGNKDEVLAAFEAIAGEIVVAMPGLEQRRQEFEAKRADILVKYAARGSTAGLTRKDKGRAKSTSDQDGLALHANQLSQLAYVEGIVKGVDEYVYFLHTQ